MLKLTPVLEPLWVSKVHLAKGNEVKLHAHEYYYHLIYILYGSYDFNFNGERRTLGENMIVLAKPGEAQSWRNVSNAQGGTYEIKFTVFDKELKDSLDVLPSALSGNEFIRLLLEKIIQERDRRRKDYQDYISIYLTTMLYDLIREKVAGDGEKDETSKRLSPAQMAVQYIDEHFGEALSLDSIAAAIRFNKSYLSAAFKREMGETVNNYIYKIRAYKACELIAYSDFSIAEVSAMIGFKNEQHFNRVFKKYIGIPPGEYRSATPRKMIHIGKENVSQFDSDVMPIRAGRSFEVDSKTGTYRPKDE